MKYIIFRHITKSRKHMTHRDVKYAPSIMLKRVGIGKLISHEIAGMVKAHLPGQTNLFLAGTSWRYRYRHEFGRRKRIPIPGMKQKDKQAP